MDENWFSKGRTEKDPEIRPVCVPCVPPLCPRCALFVLKVVSRISRHFFLHSVLWTVYRGRERERENSRLIFSRSHVCVVLRFEKKCHSEYHIGWMVSSKNNAGHLSFLIKEKKAQKKSKKCIRIVWKVVQRPSRSTRVNGWNCRGVIILLHPNPHSYVKLGFHHIFQ